MIKKTIIALVLFILGAYFMAAVSVLNKPTDDEVCTQVYISVSDSVRAGFINNEEIQRLLKKAKLYPVGEKIKNINTRKIE
ncbi:MAG: cell division protein FtsQ, partial [Bacteroidales bacterium]|nr:cell division protein FtsQ [Bacteroidales bacterium]